MSYSILDVIGNTPLVEIKNINPNPVVKNKSGEWENQRPNILGKRDGHEY